MKLSSHYLLINELKHYFLENGMNNYLIINTQATKKFGALYIV